MGMAVVEFFIEGWGLGILLLLFFGGMLIKAGRRGVPMSSNQGQYYTINVQHHHHHCSCGEQSGNQE